MAQNVYIAQNIILDVNGTLKEESVVRIRTKISNPFSFLGLGRPSET